MTIRNPMNQRTQDQLRGNGGEGATRRGMGRAKPARKAASSVRVVEVHNKHSTAGLTKEEKKVRKQEERLERDRITTASTVLLSKNPVYRQRRKLWWALLITGVGCTVVAWICFLLFPDDATMGNVGLLALIFAYVFIIGGFVWDFVRIRPIRRDSDSMVSNFTEKRIQAIIEEDYEQRAERRAARKGSMPFKLPGSKKRDAEASGEAPRDSVAKVDGAGVTATKGAGGAGPKDAGGAGPKAKSGGSKYHPNPKNRKRKKR